ncbi:hypothetical protein CEXT_806501 [Caerostris extrusa]|uniref:Uncharacterized protein n=1 Tax=Caerostris extrusa TaxID=172846 RepID=A0AAV4UCE4_CAEEX|nr:hypothetical protein CEXT_806501 [Caerostris extrusa]
MLGTKGVKVRTHKTTRSLIIYLDILCLSPTHLPKCSLNIKSLKTVLKELQRVINACIDFTCKNEERFVKLSQVFGYKRSSLTYSVFEIEPLRTKLRDGEIEMQFVRKEWENVIFSFLSPIALDVDVASLTAVMRNENGDSRGESKVDIEISANKIAESHA